MSILIVGSVAFDAIETPFGQTERVMGGSAAYAALSASYFTEDVRLVAVVGEDFPDEYLQMLKDRKVDLRGLASEARRKVFLLERTLPQRHELPRQPRDGTQCVGKL